MSNIWTRGQLSDIALITMGQSPKGDDVNSIGSGVPLLNGPTEFGGRYPTPKQFTVVGKKLAKELDLLFCVRGSTTGRMNWADQEYVIGRGLAAIRHRLEIGCQPYLRGVIEHNLQKLLVSATGSTFPNVSKDQINGLEISLPPLPEQKAIAHILGTLDDKIELNRKMNETLEAMAQAMFKSWFVDFDPVIDNALAQGNEIPEELKAKAERRKVVVESGKYKVLPKDIQDLFPSSFVYNDELEKWIPEGWSSCSLNDISDVSTGFPFKSKEYGQEEGIKVVRGENVSLGFLRWNTLKTWEGEVETLGKYWLKERDIVIGMDGSRIGRNRTFIPKYELPMLLAQRVACVRPKSAFGASFVGQIVLSDHFERYVGLVKTGTSIPHISLKQVKELSVIVPNNDLALKYSTLTDSILEKTFFNNRENSSLSKTRDILLSQLISGKTRLPKSFVKQFESQTEAVSP